MNIKQFDYQGLIDKGTVAVRFLIRYLDKLQGADFIAPLLLRLYLVPVFWMAGSNKFAHFSDTVTWFGTATSQGGLGLPAAWFWVLLVVLIEVLGALSLLLGLGVRIMSIPLMITMVFAALLVHWQNGWLAIAGSGFFANERTIAAAERLARAKAILQEHGDYTWLTEKGSYVILNNGIEFAATYFIMLLALLFMGAGRYVSADYWLKRRLDNVNGV
jgi:putative oxidoreductase